VSASSRARGVVVARPESLDAVSRSLFRQSGNLVVAAAVCARSCERTVRMPLELTDFVYDCYLLLFMFCM